MSLKQNYDFVKEAYAKQGKDADAEIDRVLREGRQRTKASAVNYLMQQVEIERVQTDIIGWWIGKVVNNFKEEKYFLFEKDGNKLHQLKRFEKDIKPFTPVKLLKADRCKNVRTGAEWVEAGEFTSIHQEDKLNVEELTEALTPFSDVIENDYYLVTGTVKFVNAAPIFDPSSPGRPTAYKPIIEHGEKGDKFNLKFTVSNAMNENINISIGKFNHLLNAYPEEPNGDYPKWFAAAKDDDRLAELQMALVGSRLVILGRGGKFIEKDGVTSEIKKPYLYVAEDGLMVNLEQWEKNGGQMKLPASAPPPPNDGNTIATAPVAPPSGSGVFSQAVMMTEIQEAVLNSIKCGKGTYKDLAEELPKKLGVETSRISEAILKLKERCEIYKTADKVYMATDALP